MLPAAALALLRPLLARAAASAVGEAAISIGARGGAARAIAGHAAKQEATAATNSVAKKFFAESAEKAGEKIAVKNPFNWSKTPAPISKKDLPNPFNWSSAPSPQRRVFDKLDEPRPSMNPFRWERDSKTSEPALNPFKWSKSPEPAATSQPPRNLFNLFKGYAGQAWDSFKQAPLYTNVRDAGQAIQTIRDKSAAPQPGPTFQNLPPSNLMAMAGRSPEQIQDADNAAKEEQLAEAQQKLYDSTKRLADGFKSLLAGGVKGLVATVTGSMAFTKANGAYVDSQVAQYGQYDASYAMIGAQRQYQEIRLNQRAAAATSGSAQALNRAQMYGKDELSRINTTLQSVVNMGALAGQTMANGVLSGFNKALDTVGLRRFIEKAEKKLDKNDNEEGPMEAAVRWALIANQARGDEKRNAPLRGVK